MSQNNENKKKVKLSSIISLLFFLAALATSGYLIYVLSIYDGIEDNIRHILMGVIGFIDFISFIKLIRVFKNKQSKRNIKKGKESKRIGYITFLLIFSIICGGIDYLATYVYGTLNSINKKTITYSSSLIVRADDKATKANELKNYKIGILSDKKSPEGYIIPQEIIKKNKLHDNNDIVEYDSYTEMIADLYAKEVDAIFLATGYPSIYSSIAGYEEIGNETKVIATKEKEMLKSKVSKKENSSTGKSVTEPFTILLMGIDSTNETLEKNAVANGDSLMLITFNPKTLNVTMLSIPRDSYVPIACWPGKAENKITHAAAYGNDCMINTIENYFDVTIDYYAKVNFKGLVKLVDALGGIDVEVPQDLCTDDSSRMNIACISKGYQHLDGEGALVLSRNRKQLVNGDFGRGQNQQLVIRAILQKIKSIKSVSQFTNVVNAVSSNIDTNLTTKQILSFYSVAKDIIKTGLSTKNSEIVSIDQLYLSGQSAMIYDKSMKMDLYNYIPNTYSRNDITKAMKQNLGLVDHKSVKTFSFSINEPYEKKIIGEGPYKSSYDASKYKSKADVEKEDTKGESKVKTDDTLKNNTNADDDEEDIKKDNNNKSDTSTDATKIPDKGSGNTGGTGGNNSGNNGGSGGSTGDNSGSGETSGGTDGNSSGNNGTGSSNNGGTDDTNTGRGSGNDE